MRHLVAAACAALLVGAPAAGAQVPGGDGLLAYMSDASTIRLLDPTSHAIVEITSGAEDAQPRWSADGGKIAFTRRTGAAAEQLWVANADGSAAVMLTPSFTWSSTAGFSPDGTGLLVSGRRGGVDGLWRIDPDGANPTLLVPGQIGAASYSPDGTRIAYSRVPAGFDDDVRIDLWVARADGTHRRRLTTGGYDIAPDWAPDGSRIAYRARIADDCDAYPGSTVEVVRTIRPNGLGMTTLSGPCESGTPSYAPSGGRIAFNQLSGDGSGRMDVYTVPAGGGAATCETCALPVGDAFSGLAWQPLPAGPRGRVRAGGVRAERIGGGAGPDVLAGAGGADRLKGQGGNDILLGGIGTDVLAGGPGRDFLAGGADADVIRARDGVRDVISGGGGRDVAYVDRLDVVRGVERVIRR